MHDLLKYITKADKEEHFLKVTVHWERNMRICWCMCVRLYFREGAHGQMLTERNICERVSEWLLIQSVTRTVMCVWQCYFNLLKKSFINMRFWDINWHTCWDPSQMANQKTIIYNIFAYYIKTQIVHKL